MASITLNLSSKIQPETGMSEILMRAKFGRKGDFRAKTGVFINPIFFEYYIDRAKTEKLGVAVPQQLITCSKKESVQKGYVLFDRGELVVRKRILTADVRYHLEVKNQLDGLLKYVLEAWNKANPDVIKKDWLQKEVDHFMHPERYTDGTRSFFELMEDFKNQGEKSESSKISIDVLIRALKRYEAFVKLSQNKNFCLDLCTMNKETLSDFESFYRNEYQLIDEYPNIYKQIPSFTKKRKSKCPKQRTHNTICALFRQMRGFFNWCIKQGVTNNNPFNGFDGVGSEVYGTPYFLSLEERDTVADFDMSNYPDLAVQRDIFVFQCLVGCRVSDLLRLTKDNIVDGDFLEYIPVKTRKINLNTVRVPLCSRAKVILKRYEDTGTSLFPFVSPEKYNIAIRKILKICGINRMVTVLDGVSGKEVQKPIYEIASSHMARRTFVGNLYKKVSDPCLITELSGHVSGSRAFARYRKIDDDLKTEIIKLID